MKNVLNLTKSLLLTATILVFSLGFMPQPAEAVDITITCDGSSALCAILETPDVIIYFFLGNWTSIEISF